MQITIIEAIEQSRNFKKVVEAYQIVIEAMEELRECKLAKLIPRGKEDIYIEIGRLKKSQKISLRNLVEWDRMMRSMPEKLEFEMNYPGKEKHEGQN